MPLIIPGTYPTYGVGGQFSQNQQGPGNGGGGGNGNVTGPASSLIHSVARFLDASGKIIQDSLVTIDDAGNMATVGRFNGRDVAADGITLDSISTALLRLPTSDQKDALAGTVNSPSASNLYVTNDDPRLAGGGVQIGGQIGGTNSVPYILGMRETGGPTLLTYGIVPDASVLQRVGSTIVGLNIPFVNESMAITAISFVITTQTYVAVSSTAAARTITLPVLSSVAEGKEIRIQDTSRSAGSPYGITVTPAGSDTINGSTSSRHLNVPSDMMAVKKVGGVWIMTQMPSNVLNIGNFGALAGDGVTDDYAIIQAALDSGPVAAGDPSGFRVFLPRGSYRISQSLKVRRCIVFEGEGSGSFNGYGTKLVPDKGIEGITICGVFDSGVADMRSDLCIVRNMGIFFGNSQQPAAWQTAHGYVVGDLVVPRTSAPAHHFVFQCTTAGTSAGSDPVFTGPGYDGDTVTDGGVVWTARDINGINMRCKSTVENIAVSRAPGNGLRIWGNTGASPSTNINQFVVRRLSVLGAGLNGMFIVGPDANAGYLEKCFTSTARFWGVYDSSFLGNTHVAHDTDSNGLGAYKMDSPDANGLLLGCYSESGQPPSSILAPSCVIGGTHGAGFVAGFTGLRNIGAAVSGDTPFTVSGGPSGIVVNISSDTTDQYALRFHHTSETGDIRLAHSPSGPYAGWWSYNYAGLDGATFLGMSSENAAEGYGHLWLAPSDNTGWYFLGFPKQRIGTSHDSPGISSGFKRGDWFHNRNVDFQDTVSNDGVAGWHYDTDSTTVAQEPWTARWSHWGHGNQLVITGTVGSPYAINLRSQSGMVFSNEGASAKVAANLPLITSGVFYEHQFAEFSFIVVDADGLRVKSRDAVIRCGAQVTASAGYLESTTIGSTLTVKCYSSGLWYVTKITGTWTDGTSAFPTSAASQIIESSGPTTLDIGAIANGQSWKRSGTSMVGFNPVEGTGTYPNLPYWSNVSGGPQQSDTGIPYTSLALITNTVVDHATGIALANSDSGASHTNFGASGSVTLTSPASPTVGFKLRMRVMVAHNFVFQLPGSHQLYVDDVNATTVGGTVTSNTIGSAIDIEYVGNSKWFCQVNGTWSAL